MNLHRIEEQDTITKFCEYMNNSFSSLTFWITADCTNETMPGSHLHFRSTGAEIAYTCLNGDTTYYMREWYESQTGRWE